MWVSPHSIAGFMPLCTIIGLPRNKAENRSLRQRSADIEGYPPCGQDCDHCAWSEIQSGVQAADPEPC